MAATSDNNNDDNNDNDDGSDVGSDGGHQHDSNSITRMEETLAHVYQLMVSKSRGRVETDEVEHAVVQLLQCRDATTGRPPPPPPPLDDNVVMVQPDLDDYDDDDHDNPIPAANLAPKQPPRATKFPQATLQEMVQPQQQQQQHAVEHKDDPYDDIPLGRAGAKMLVTFGDGPRPNPSAVSAALLGARSRLQVSIKDARALRRSQKEEYARARRQGVAAKNNKKKRRHQDEDDWTQEESASAEIMYRAMQGWDKLAYDPKCGFDVEQLRQLFPEEMQAYSRWKEMHKEYKIKSTSDKEDATGEQEQQEETGAETSVVQNKTITTDVPVANGGHLEERAAQFDVRTDEMEQDWYLKFSEVRRGSFLPRKSGMKRANEKQWEEQRKKPRGRPKAGNWETMSATSVRFLHWVGFDPRSALAPPNDEVTEALAFLAYDFMGRIVEKAIYLKNIAANNNNNNKIGNVLLELRDGQQLDAEDIEKAIHDSTIRPVPLYSSLDKPVAAQLYFGPGFEDRLEMEMEELASKRKRLSPQELEIRKQEDELFRKLEAPPAFDGFQNVLDEEDAKDDCSEVTLPTSNKKTT
jgi:hypothetical protein